MPPTPSTAKKQRLTLAQLSAYDDILTDALVDHAYYWTTVPKNRTSYHPSRGVKEEEIAKIIQSHLVVDPNLDVAEGTLLATAGLRNFYNGLKTQKEKDDFKRHLRRYMQIYLPDCPFEVSSTNRYSIVTHEAAVTARRFIKKGESIKYLSGIQVLISAKEEEDISKRKKDFSIVVSSRNKCASLFMGPARLANHDCEANARLVITSQATIEIFACRNIDVGEEITVTYGDNYFGEDNCECLCQTCEDNLVNGWSQGENGTAALVKKSIEEAMGDGYSLRRRRGRNDSSARSSRTPSVTPSIRPRVPKSRSKTLMDSGCASTTGSPAPEILLRQKRKREIESLASPPVTPSKKLKTMKNGEVEAIPVPAVLSRQDSDGESSASGSGSASDLGSGESIMTNITTPDEEMKEPQLVLQSPTLTPTKSSVPSLKMEHSGSMPLSDVAVAPPSCEVNDVIMADPLPSVELTPATGIPVVTMDFARQANDSVSDSVEVDVIVIPPPLTPATKLTEQLPPTPATNDTQTSDITPKRGRGRPRKYPRDEPSATTPSKATPSKAAVTVAESPEAQAPPPVAQAPAPLRETSPSDSDSGDAKPVRVRTPGDYTLTPLLLSEPEMAWIYCTICNNAFVQQNAYFTRSACPRCERHSKLYGYQWPKTESEGKHDKEERVLDHREVHRFLAREDEARIRGRKGWTMEDADKQVETSATSKTKSVKATPQRRKRASTGYDDDGGDYKTDATDEPRRSESVRRSGRRRNPSLKATDF